MSVQNDQVVDLSARSNIASIANEQLDNEMALIEDRFKYPFRVTVSSSSVAIGTGKFNSLKSDSADSTTNSYVWRNSFFGNRDGAISNMSLNVSTGAASSPNGATVCPSVTANNWIQLGIELRSDLLYHFVWGTQHANKASTTPPRFSNGAIQVCIIYLQSGATGVWGFLNPIETDVEIIKGNKIHITDSPVRMYSLKDTKIYFDLDEYMDSDGAGVKEAMLNGLFPSVVASSYDFQNTNPSTTGNTFVGTTTRPTTTINEFRRVGFTLLGSGSIHVIWSASSVSEGGLADPSTLFLAKGYPIGWIDLQGLGGVDYKTIYSITNIIEASSQNASSNPSATVSRIHRVINTNVNPEDYVGDEFFGMYNLSLVATAGSNQITIGLRSADGSNFSTSNRGILNFKNTTSATGTLLKTTLTANPTDFVVSAGANLGLLPGATFGTQNVYFYVYARYESATSITLSVCSHALEEGDAILSVAMSATSDTAKTLYAIDATTKRVRCLGVIRATKDGSDNWTVIMAIQTGPQGNQTRQMSLISPTIDDDLQIKELSGTPNRPITGYKKILSESLTGYSDKSLLYVNSDAVEVGVLDQKHISPVEGLHNISLEYSTASSGAFTITLRGSAGTNNSNSKDLSTSNHACIVFKNNSGTNPGQTYPVYLSANATVTVLSGATLGLPVTSTNRLYVYAIYQSASSIALGVSSMLFHDDENRASTTFATTSDDSGKIYSDTGVSANSIRLIGYVEASYANSPSVGYWNTPTKAYTGHNASITNVEQINNENYIDNGDFQIMQRGDYDTLVSSATTGVYYLDRWKTDFNVNSSLQRLQGSQPHQYLSKLGNSVKLICTSGNSGAYMTVMQTLDDSSKYYNKLMIFSAWVKSNSSNARLMVYDGTNYLGATTNNHTGGGGWELLICPFVATSGTLRCYVGIIGTSVNPPSSLTVTIATNDYFETTGIKLESGSYATPFVARSYKDELVRCQRYFVKLAYITGGGMSIGPFYYSNAGQVLYSVPGNWGFRTTPTLTFNAGTTATVYDSAGTTITGTTISSVYSSENLLSFRIVKSATFVQTLTYWIYLTGTPSEVYLSADY